MYLEFWQCCVYIDKFKTRSFSFASCYSFQIGVKNVGEKKDILWHSGWKWDFFMEKGNEILICSDNSFTYAVSVLRRLQWPQRLKVPDP